MPYRILGNKVQVQREGGRWETLKQYPSRVKALAYFRALVLNAEHKGEKKT